MMKGRSMPLVLLIPLIVGALSQISKLVIKKTTRFNQHVVNLFSYSGMPSTHSSMVTSLAVVTGLSEGIHSAAFAITFVIGGLIIRDALGLRNYVNKSLEDIHSLVKELPPERQKPFTFLNVRVGHTRWEVLVGMVFGAVLGYVLYIVMR